MTKEKQNESLQRFTGIQTNSMALFQTLQHKSCISLSVLLSRIFKNIQMSI